MLLTGSYLSKKSGEAHRLCKDVLLCCLQLTKKGTNPDVSQLGKETEWSVHATEYHGAMEMMVWLRQA